MTSGKRAILFDLDGTLVDTAPDMVRVLAEMIDDHEGTPLPYETVRSVVSNGSLGLVRLGFPHAAEADLAALQSEYLERYAREVCRDSTLFPGLDRLLDRLDDNGRQWGVVTNKPTRMTHDLLAALGLESRAACIVCGDTLPQRKPDPAPLLHAAAQTGVAAAESIYIGDALRDIEAGRAAGMATVAAAYGYIVEGDSAHAWQADQIAADPDELARIIATSADLPG